VLAIRSKRYSKKPVDFLTELEVEALLDAPDQATWSGRRDRMLLCWRSRQGCGFQS
jgi:integrase/recombinase XerD